MIFMILAAFCTESLGKQHSGSLVMISWTLMSVSSTILRETCSATLTQRHYQKPTLYDPERSVYPRRRVDGSFVKTASSRSHLGRPFLFFTSLAEAAWKDGEVYRNALLAST